MPRGHPCSAVAKTFAETWVLAASMVIRLIGTALAGQVPGSGSVLGGRGKEQRAFLEQRWLRL